MSFPKNNKDSNIFKKSKNQKNQNFTFFKKIIFLKKQRKQNK